MSDDSTDDQTVTTDPEEIRSWAEARDLVPAYVRADEAAELEAEAGGRYGFVHRDESGEGHERRDWDAFLEAVEDEDLALTYRDAGEEAWGQYALVERSRAAEVSREDLRAAGPPPEEASGSAAAEADEAPGEAARERVATELAGREVIDADWIDDDTVELVVEEAWLVTEEVVEGEDRRTVERDVTERRRLTADIVDSVVVESGTANREVLERGSTDAGEQTADEGTEASEGIPTEAGVTGETPPADENPPAEGRGEPAPAEEDGEAPGEVNAAGESGATDELGGAGTSTPDERPDQAEGSPGTDDPRGTADATVNERDEGKTVVDANDNEVGVVTDVRGGEVYVDPNPDVVERVAAKLGWGSADEETYVVDQGDVTEVRADEVELAPLEGREG